MARRARKKCRIDPPPGITTRSASVRSAEITIAELLFLHRVMEELRTPSVNAVKLLGVLHLLANESSTMGPGSCNVRKAACECGHLEIAQFLVSHGAQIISPEDSPAQYAPLLNLASRAGHLRTVQWLVENDVDLEEASYGNDTALIAATANGRSSVVKYLIALGANTKKKTWTGMGARSGAALAGNLQLLQYLVEQHIGEFDEEGNKFDLLRRATLGGHTSIIKLVLEQDNWDRSALSESLVGAVRYKDAEMAELFLKYGAGVNAADAYGKSAVYYAIESEALEIAELLILAGADLKKEAPPDGFTAVHAMARIASLHLFQVATRVCENPAEVFSVSATPENVTPLEIAALKGSMDIVDFLLQMHPINLESEFGNTLLSAAAHRGHLDLIKSFLSKGVPIEGARSVAAMCGECDILEYLCANGADVQGVTDCNETALYFAAERGNFLIVDLLVQFYEADINHANSFGYTPADVARCHEHSEVLVFLLLNGALPQKKGLYGVDDIDEMNGVQETDWSRHVSLERFIEEFIV